MKKFILKHKLLLALNIALVIGISFAEALQAILFKTIVDTVTGVLNYQFSTLALMAGVFLIAVFVLEVTSKASAAAMNKAVMLDYKQAIISSFIRLETQKKMTSSEIISLLSNDIKVIEDSYLKSCINIFKDIFLFLVALYLLLRINIYLTIAIILFGWIPIVVPHLFMKKNQLLKGNYLKSIEIFINRIKEVAQGFEVIKGFNIEDKVITLTEEDNRNAEVCKFKSSSFEGFLGATSIVSGFSIFFLNLLIAGYFVMKGDITVGSMIAAVQLMNYIVNPLISISQYTTSIRSVSKVIDEIRVKLIENNNDSKERYQERFEFDKCLNIENLIYSYEGEKEVISDISLKIEKGKKYALVGESGCGKTTLLKILMNQITDYKGSVMVDGKEIRLIEPKSYYKKVTPIQQKVFMFRDTIKNNICLYNDCNSKKINNVIQQSGLTNTIQKQEKGLETIVGEGGLELSGGEVQRIAIARALIKESEILLVDEATSALDKVMAREIENTLMSIDATVLAITHQLDDHLLSKYDEILVMRDGKIIESGTFTKLIENKGYFYYMYSNGEMQRAEVLS